MNISLLNTSFKPLHNPKSAELKGFGFGCPLYIIQKEMILVTLIKRKKSF